MHRRLFGSKVRPNVYTARIFMKVTITGEDVTGDEAIDNGQFEPLIQNLPNMSAFDLYEMAHSSGVVMIIYKNDRPIASHGLPVRPEWFADNYFEHFQQWYEQTTGKPLPVEVNHAYYPDGVEDNFYYFTQIHIWREDIAAVVIYKLVEYMPNININDFIIDEDPKYSGGA